MEEQDLNRRRDSTIDKLNNAASTIQKARFLASAIQKSSTVVKVAPILPWVLAVVGVGIIILVIIFLLTGGGAGGPGSDGNGTPGTPGPETKPVPGLELSKAGPLQVDNGGVITFTIGKTYSGSAEVVLTDPIPSKTKFVSATGTYKETKAGDVTTAVSWSLKENGVVSDSQNTTPKTFNFSITLQPLENDIWVVNNISARSEMSMGNSDLAKIFPQSLESTDITDGRQQDAVNALKNNPNFSNLLSTYKKASEVTGVNWEILAGIHYREAGFNPNGSLASGRPIGGDEPDVRSSTGGCTPNNEEGKPIPVPGGCGFRNLTDSAIWSANHLKGKNGGPVPDSYETIIASLSRYNGGGNSNCNKTPYPASSCPPSYFGEDDTYVMNFLDRKHEKMYIVYCGDFTLCQTPNQDSRPGVLTVTFGLLKFLSP